MKRYWDEAIETMPREQLRHLQLERLQVTLNRACAKVDLYRQRFRSLGLDPEEVRSLDDVLHLPFTTASDLAASYPYGLFSVPLKSIVRLQVPAPHRARPFVVGYTRRDIATWQQLMARHFTAMGVGSSDVVQVAFNYGLFTGAFTFNQAAELIGATVAPTSIASATLQLQIMQDFHSTVIATPPSFAMHIATTMERRGIDPHSLFLHSGIFGPEAMRAELRAELEDRLHVRAYAVYGVNEMVEPGVAGECQERAGLHLAEDHFYAESIDPENGTPLPPGQEGELVITTLTNEGYPLIRFRTGDITTLELEPCGCGRTSLRLRPVLRRVDDLVTVRGISFYPAHVAALIREVAPQVAEHRLLVRRRQHMNDELEVHLGLTAEGTADWPKVQPIADRVRAHLRRGLGLGVKVKAVSLDKLRGRPGEVIYQDE